MSRVGFYGEGQSEALKRHVVLSHTTCRSITRVRLTSDLPVPSAPEIFQSAMWYGIIPAWVVLCHSTWLENRKSKREPVCERQFSTYGIPKSVRMEMSLTSSKDSRHCKRKSLKFWSKNAFQKKRRGPPKPDPGAGRDHSLNMIFKFLTVCHSMNEVASPPTTETFLFTHYGGK